MRLLVLAMLAVLAMPGICPAQGAEPPPGLRGNAVPGASLQGRPGNEDMLHYSFAVVRSLAADGFQMRELQTGRLRQGESWFFTTQLAAGNEYYFFVAGDPDLKAIDLRLYDEQWQLVSADTRHERTGQVQMVADWGGAYHLKVTMVDCNDHGAEWFLVSAYK